MLQLDYMNTERKAKAFLKRLAPNTSHFTFQTFDDSVDKDRKLSRIFNGTLDKHLRTLTQLNKKGAGVYIVANSTDLKGRKLDNIVGVRALWCEQDHGEVPDFPIAPHMRISSSKGKYHHYFLVSDGENSRTVEEFAAVQQRLVDDWQSDPNAKDVSRVLRLPGFYHMKVPTDPQKVEVVQDSGAKACKWGQLKTYFPPVEPLDPLDELETILDREGELLKPALILSALAFVDPDTEYQKWLNVGMALHKESNSSEEGFNIWDNWSAKGIDYKVGETTEKWKSFGNRSKGVDVREATIFNYAYENGWNGHYYESPDVIKAASLEWYRQLKKLSDRFALVSVEGQVRVVFREYDYSIAQWKTQFQDRTNFDLYHCSEYIPSVVVDKEGAPTIKKVLLTKAWWVYRGKHQYRSVIFKPRVKVNEGKGISEVLPKTRDYNMYLGLNVIPDVIGLSPCKLLKEHIRVVWCNKNPQLYEYILDWFARLFQYPGKLAETALVLKSDEGAGKNIIIDPLLHAFGSNSFTATDQNAILGEFNAPVARSVLVLANEATWGGDKKAEGRLKSLITDPIQPFNQKFLPVIPVPNCCHLIIASNNDWVVPVGVGNRRLVIMQASDERKGDFKYFEQLGNEIQEGGTAAFIGELLERDITKFNPKYLPSGFKNEFEIEQKLHSADSITKWWMECLHQGTFDVYGVDGFLGSIEEKEWQHTAVNIPNPLLYETFKRWHLSSHMFGEVPTQRKFALDLKKFGGMSIGGSAGNAKLGGGTRGIRLWRLDKAQDAMASHFSTSREHLFDEEEENFLNL